MTLPTRHFPTANTRTWITRLGWGLLFLVLSIPYLRALALPEVGFFHDDGIYLATAEALARGEGYRLVNLPTEPLQTKYPPLFPLLLSLVIGIFPDFPGNLPALKMVPALSAFAWMLLTYRLLRRIGTSGSRALAILALVMASPLTLKLSTSLLTETLFASLATASVLCLEESGQNALQGRRKVIAAGLLTAMAILTRTIGISLLVGGIGWLLWKSQGRKALWYTTTAGLLTAPWFLWVCLYGGTGYYSSANYTSWHIFSAALDLDIYNRLAVPMQNLIHLAAFPGLSLQINGVAGATLAIVFAIALPIGALRTIRTAPAAMWVLGGYLALVLCWVWAPARFFLVVAPLLYWLASNALPQRRTATGRYCLVLMTLLICIPGMWESHKRIQEAHGTGVLLWSGKGPETWTDFLQITNWIRTNTDPNTVVVGNLDPALHLYSDRKAIRGFEADPYALFYDLAGQRSDLRLTYPLPLLPESRHDDATPIASYIVVESPDSDFSERAALHAEIRRLETRGDLKPIFRSGAFRVLQPVTNR